MNSMLKNKTPGVYLNLIAVLFAVIAMIGYVAAGRDSYGFVPMVVILLALGIVSAIVFSLRDFFGFGPVVRPCHPALLFAHALSPVASSPRPILSCPPPAAALVTLAVILMVYSGHFVLTYRGNQTCHPEMAEGFCNRKRRRAGTMSLRAGVNLMMARRVDSKSRYLTLRLTML